MDFFNLDGIKISSTSRAEITEYLMHELINSPKPRLWVTFNLDFFRISSENIYFNNICKNADIILPDGSGIIHLINALSGKKIRRITGNDIFNITLQLSNKVPFKVAFVGSTKEVICNLQRQIKSDYPDLDITAAISPPQFFEKDSGYVIQLIEELKNSKPDILFLAIGCPRQELFLYENMDKIGAKINIGVGSAFDFFTGERKRSPKVLQDWSLEWFWRLMHEPKRLSNRYLVKDLPFFIKKFAQYKFNAKE